MENMLADYVEGHECVERGELIQLFGDQYTVPAYDALSKRYIAGKISQELSRARDGKNRRQILAVRGRDGIKYVYVPVCKNLPVLKSIKERILHDIDGQSASLEKVDVQIAAVEEDG